MKYAVQQYCFDSVRSQIIPPIEVGDDCWEVVEEDFNLHRDCDYYRYVFDRIEDAEEFYSECLLA